MAATDHHDLVIVDAGPLIHLDDEVIAQVEAHDR
jgi:hypothetical protein